MTGRSEPGQNEEKKVNKLVVYSGMAFQLMAVIVAGYFIGKWIDTRMNNDKPYMTALVILALMSMFLYSMIRSLTRKE